MALPVDTISISMRKLLAHERLGSGDYKVKALVGTPDRLRVPQERRMRRRAARAAADFVAMRAGLPPARQFDRRRSASSVPGHGGAPRSCGGEQGDGGALSCARWRTPFASSAIRPTATRSSRTDRRDAPAFPKQIARRRSRSISSRSESVLPQQGEIDMKGMAIRRSRSWGRLASCKAPLPAAASASSTCNICAPPACSRARQA